MIETRFMFATGLSKPIEVQAGTLASIEHHVQRVESRLGLKVANGSSPPRWDTHNLGEGITDDVFCEEVTSHNNVVDWLWREMRREHAPTEAVETITPEQAAKFWHALVKLDVPPARWNAGYYRARMEHAYEVMRGRESEGETMRSDVPPLTPEQAGAVVHLFEQWLRRDDLDLEVVHGEDGLSSHGEYDWCDQCGAVHAVRRPEPLVFELGGDEDGDDDGEDSYACPICEQRLDG
jgi:hypothetical protein